MYGRVQGENTGYRIERKMYQDKERRVKVKLKGEIICMGCKYEVGEGYLVRVKRVQGKVQRYRVTRIGYRLN